MVERTIEQVDYIGEDVRRVRKEQQPRASERLEPPVAPIGAPVKLRRLHGEDERQPGEEKIPDQKGVVKIPGADHAASHQSHTDNGGENQRHSGEEYSGCEQVSNCFHNQLGNDRAFTGAAKIHETLPHLASTIPAEKRSRLLIEAGQRTGNSVTFPAWDANGYMPNGWSPASRRAARPANLSVKSPSLPRWV